MPSGPAELRATLTLSAQSCDGAGLRSLESLKSCAGLVCGLAAASPATAAVLQACVHVLNIDYLAVQIRLSVLQVASSWVGRQHQVEGVVFCEV